jgi:oxalate decarboxylase/phosphoglucose isomerase-like protein (cupin superfamily)
MSMAAVAQVPQVDPKIVGFKLPDQIEWKANPAGTNRSAVLQGDPSKAGPYAVLLQWLPGNMSRPHFHPNDRYITVLSGTWWVNPGAKYDPAGFKPVTPGSFVVHTGKEIHYDGAKDEEAVILITGMGPATGVAAEQK